MKKILVTVFALSAICLTVSAQDEKTAPPSPPIGQHPEINKEQREAMKQKRDAELNNALDAAQLTDDQKKEAKVTLETAQKARIDLRKNNSLTEEQRRDSLKGINEDQQSKLIKIMGEVKFRKYREVLKKSREANERVSPVKPEN